MGKERRNYQDSEKILYQIGVRAGERVADLGCGLGLFNEIKRISKKEGRMAFVDWYKKDSGLVGPPLHARLSES